MTPAHRFHAFISYSHSADEQLARQLQHALQQFAKPLFALRALEVFRDQTDLAANPAVWPTIEKALNESEYFLLFASPRAAQSKWVKREIDHWLQTHGGKAVNLLILWTDGELAWGNGDFAWPQTTALPHVLDWDPDDPKPRTLAGAFSREVPNHVDLRWTRTQERLSERDPKFLDAVATVAAQLHDKPKRNLIGRDVAEHAKLKRWTATAIAVLIVLTLAAGVFAVVARKQTGIARERRAQAEREAAIALSRQLAAQSQERAPQQLDLALLLAVAATRVADTEQSRGALFDALQTAGHVRTFVASTDRILSAVTLSADGSRITTADSDGSLIVRDAKTGRQLASAPQSSPIDAMVAHPTQPLLFTSGRERAVRVWRLPSLAPVDAFRAEWAASIAALAISPDGKSLAAASGAVRVLDLATRTWSEPIAPRPGAYVRAIDFHPGGSVIAFAYDDGDIQVWDRASSTRLQQLRGHDTPFISQTMAGAVTRTDASVDAVAFSPDGDTLATGGYDGRVVFWDWRNGRQRAATAPRERSPIRAIAFSADGSTLYAGTSGGTVQAFFASDGSSAARAVHAHQGQISALDVAGTQVATVGWDGLVLLWDFARWPLGRHLPLPATEPPADSVQETMIRDLVVSARGIIATTSNRYPLRLWDPDAPARNRELAAANGVHHLALAGDAIVYVDDAGQLLRRDLRNADAPPVVVARLDALDALAATATRITTATARGAVEMIELANGARTKKTVPVAEDASDVAVAADGTILASRSESEVVVAEVASGKVLLRKPATSASIALSPDGQLLAVNRYQFTDVWDVQRGTVRHTIDHVARGVAPGLTFSPDNRVLVVYGGSYQPELWDMQSGLLTLRIRNPVEISGGAHAFTPDGKTFAESHSDGSVSVWNLDPAEWQRAACGIANRAFTDDERRRYGNAPALQQVCASTRSPAP